MAGKPSDSSDCPCAARRGIYNGIFFEKGWDP